MIKLTIKNLEQIEKEDLKKFVSDYISQKVELFENYFKRYPEDVPITITFNKKPSGWKVEGMVEMISDTLYFEESGKNLKDVLAAVLNAMKKQIKKQKALERKDYQYKRSKYRKKLLSQKAFENLIKYKKENNKTEFDKELQAVYKDLETDISENYQNKGISKEEADKIAKMLMEKIKDDVFNTFNSEPDEREEFLDSISDISIYHEKNYKQ